MTAWKVYVISCLDKFVFIVVILKKNSCLFLVALYCIAPHTRDYPKFLSRRTSFLWWSSVCSPGTCYFAHHNPPRFTRHNADVSRFESKFCLCFISQEDCQFSSYGNPSLVKSTIYNLQSHILLFSRWRGWVWLCFWKKVKQNLKRRLQICQNFYSH